MKNICALSYFHRKIGPMIFYSYPENLLNERLSSRIANIMDQQFNEGFFTHSFEEIKTLNYYFEIQSDWARGNNDMLMISIIFDQQPSPKLEDLILDLFKDFSEKLKSNEEIFTAFHINDLNSFDKDDKELIEKNYEMIKFWVKELYWQTAELTREKTEEEKIAALLKNRHIFLTLRKLTKGPLPLEWLREWFKESFSEKDFDDMITTLEEKQLIFINQIGLVEKYVLLLKEVNAERIPPDSVIEYIDETPDLISLILPIVQEYFSNYELKSDEELNEDSYLLFQIIADPKKYNVLSELRNGLIPQDKLPKLVSKRNLDALSKVLDFLKKKDIIEELKYKGERYIVLKTNLKITTAFPEYLRKLLPEEVKPVIVNRYENEEEKKQEELAEYFRDARNQEENEKREIDVGKFLGELSPQNKRKYLESEDSLYLKALQNKEKSLKKSDHEEE
ncbi:MAG: hypothetical protein P8Y70_13530 [Candidatus Lokiarchaeota archaeon]